MTFLSTPRGWAMRSVSLVLLFATAASTFALDADKERVRLVEEGKAQAAIFIADTPTPAARLAAIELQYAVEKMAGVTLPIHHASDEVEPVETKILIGDQPATRALGLDPDKFDHNEYLCRVEPGRVVLFGQDAATSSGKHINFNEQVYRPGVLTVQLPGMYEPQGSLRAMYHFLESLGVRYYGPREHLCIYPKSKSISSKTHEVQREPAIGYTNGLSTDDNGGVYFPIQRILYNQPSHHEVLLFARRIRTGGKEWKVVNHSLGPMRLKERFGPPPANGNDIHEAYYPDIWPPAGSPAHQPCYSSTRLSDLMAKDAADYFNGKLKDKPYGPTPDQDVYTIVPNDAYGFCTCQTCTTSYGTYEKPGYDGAFGSGIYSDNFFSFLNRVAKPLAKSHPDKFIATLAYEGYFWPPKNIEVDANILVSPCIVTCDHWKRVQKKSDEKAYDYWIDRAKRLDHPIYMWNYYHHPEELGMIRGHKVFPQFSPKHIHQLARKYKKDGVDGVFLCGWGEGIDFYILMKSFDDPDLDLDAILDEYFTLSFGEESAPYMKRFYLMIEKISMRPMDGPVQVDERFFWERQGDEQTLDHLEKLLDKAESSLPSDNDAQHRFGAYRELMNYMKQGRAEWLAKQVLAE